MILQFDFEILFGLAPFLMFFFIICCCCGRYFTKLSAEERNYMKEYQKLANTGKPIPEEMTEKIKEINKKMMPGVFQKLNEANQRAIQRQSMQNNNSEMVPNIATPPASQTIVRPSQPIARPRQPMQQRTNLSPNMVASTAPRMTKQPTPMNAASPQEMKRVQQELAKMNITKIKRRNISEIDPNAMECPYCGNVVKIGTTMCKKCKNII